MVGLETNSAVTLAHTQHKNILRHTKRTHMVNRNGTQTAALLSTCSNHTHAMVERGTTHTPTHIPKNKSYVTREQKHAYTHAHVQ